VYRTDDNGETFSQLGDASHNDLVSIDFTDPDRQTLITGGHEQPQIFKRSQDGGETWEALGMNVPGDCRQSTYPLALNAAEYLLGCLNGILRTSDAGETWEPVSLSGGFGPPLYASDGAIYWPLENNGGMVVSTDGGVQWERRVGTGVITSARPLELPDGRIATIGGGRSVVVSSDGGESWDEVTLEVPSLEGGTLRGLTYSTARRAFYVWLTTCDDEIPSGAILSAEFDYETR
jgi:photosystem II stability/assembly factor-like uncharacterized protein